MPDLAPRVKQQSSLDHRPGQDESLDGDAAAQFFSDRDHFGDVETALAQKLEVQLFLERLAVRRLAARIAFQGRGEFFAGDALEENKLLLQFHATNVMLVVLFENSTGIDCHYFGISGQPVFAQERFVFGI